MKSRVFSVVSAAFLLLSLVPSIGLAVSDGVELPDSMLTDQPTEWARTDVTSAISLGLVPGNLQSKYTQVTTRSEFCALAVTLYETIAGQAIAGRNKFDDTTDINVEKAAYIGVVHGTSLGKFTPNTLLPREQAATMLARLAEVIGKSFDKKAPTFADNNSISDWAFEAVGQVQAAEIMNGISVDKFAPKGLYTREQSIITILRMYNWVINPEAVPPVEYITVKGQQFPTSLTELSLSNMELTNADIVPLSKMTNLTYLSLWGNENISDVNVLNNLTKLRVLILSANNINDVNAIGKLTNLTELDLWSNDDIRDITALGNLTNLTKLDLFNAKISDVGPLGKLTKLTELSIGGYNSNISDITALSNLTNLTSLGLYETHVSDLRPIEDLTKLEGLSLGRTKVSDLSSLSKLTNLTSLGLDDLVISNFSPLYKLPKLNSLNLQSSSINDDLSRLGQFPHLTSLTLFNCGISDVTALGALTNLTFLSLGYNQITDVSALGNLTNLRLLDLGKNNITDISALSNLTNMTQLYVENNPLTQDQINALRAKLPGCSICFQD